MAQPLFRHPLGFILCVVVLAMSMLRPAHADVLAEYFFWDRMGNAAGKAVGEYQNYRRERELWTQRIAEAKAELQRCGGCASAQAELDKWQGIENEFQEVAGSLAASVGMPRVVADFLDIDMPLFAPRSPHERAQECALSLPSWTRQRPAFCQQAVQEHFACLNDFEEANGVCSAQVATQAGGACWQTRKLFVACAKQDYDGFEREKAAEALRRSDPTIPEIIDEDGTNINLVMYEHADDDFALPMPPKVVIDEAFENKDTLREIHFVIPRSKRGPLWRADIKPFFWDMVAPDSRCHAQDRPDDEMTKRVCADLEEIRYHDLPVIACWYGSPQGGVPADAVYWYDKPVPLVDARRLLERDRHHPLLGVGEVRSECPATANEADTVEQRYRTRLAALGVQQIPDSQRLPRSAFLQEIDRKRQAAHAAEVAARLAVFPLEGWYTWQIDRGDGRRTASADCLIESAGEGRYNINCKSGRSASTGDAVIGERGLHVSWSNGTASVFKDGTSLTSDQNGATKIFGRRKLVSWYPDEGDGWSWRYSRGDGNIEILSRNGNVLPERFVELVAEYPFEGDYELEANYGDEQVRLPCKVERNASHRPNAFMILCYREDGAAFRSEGGVPQQQSDGPTVLLYYSFSPALIVGDQDVRDFRLPIDAAARGNSAASILEGENEDGVHLRLTRTGPATLPFTPLEALNMKRAYIEGIRDGGINSVEQLAAMTYEEARSRRIGWIAYRDAARAFLAAKDVTAPASDGASTSLPLEDKATSATQRPRIIDAQSGGAAPPVKHEVGEEASDENSAVVSLAACPASFKAFGDARGRFECDCAPPWRDYLYGTGIYTDTSSVCAAAQHAGVIGETGGRVRAVGIEGVARYVGSHRNGAMSRSWGAWPDAFSVQALDGAQPSAAKAPASKPALPACPNAFRDLRDPQARYACTCVPPWRDYLYGTGIYTDTSSVCAAAQHAGLVGPSGGAIVVIGVKGADSYEGSVQHDVESKSWGAWPRAFQLLPDGLTASATPTGQ